MTPVSQKLSDLRQFLQVKALKNCNIQIFKSQYPSEFDLLIYETIALLI